MGTSTNSKQLLGKVNKFALAIPNAHKEGVYAGAARGKAIVVRVAASRGVAQTAKIARGRWSVRYDVKGTADPTALLRILGPFQLVESDTKPHEIRPKTRGRRSRGAQKKAVSFNLLTRRKFNHPGTRGKRIWADSKKEILDEVPEIVFRRTKTALVQTFT